MSAELLLERALRLLEEVTYFAPPPSAAWSGARGFNRVASEALELLEDARRERILTGMRG